MFIKNKSSCKIDASLNLLLTLLTMIPEIKFGVLNVYNRLSIYLIHLRTIYFLKSIIGQKRKTQEFTFISQCQISTCTLCSTSIKISMTIYLWMCLIHLLQKTKNDPIALSITFSHSFTFSHNSI